MTAFSAWAYWVESTPLSLMIQTHSWVIPATQSVHIIALAVTFASVVMLDARLIGLVGRGQPLRPAAARFLPAVWYALPLSAATGAILILGEPSRELLSPYFWAKMAMLAAVIVLTLAVRPLLEDVPLVEQASGRQWAIRAMGSVSLLLWLAIIFCGRWIAYG